MGDKSPKAKNRQRKQEVVRQTQKKDAAALKVPKAAPEPTKAKKPVAAK